MRKLILIALLALSLHAETVYITAHGKTYHTDRKCMALARAADVLTTDDKTAEAHGLHECAICAHRHAKTGKASNDSWARKEVAK